jgi:hypothetical protein
LIGISPIENQYNNQVKIVRTGDENVFADAHKGSGWPGAARRNRSFIYD